MRNRFISFVSAMVCIAGVAKAQVNPCSTDEHYRKLLKQYPQLAEYEKQFEVQMKMAYKITAAPDTTTYDVPMVVHVVHDYGTENINDTVIYQAVQYWSKVFTGQNYEDTAAVIAPFKKYIGNPKVRLHLATKDPSGNPTKGVVRHFSYLSATGSDQAKYSSWPNNKYINVWFIKSFNSSHAGAAAYAYYPSSGASMPYYDGVIGLADYIDVQKTIPHELGHVLNLSHTWGSTNAPGVACGDDNVWDTPPTEGHTSCGASAMYDVTCATGYTHTFVSVSGLPDSVVNYPDTVNAQNIMDYSYCELMFTQGQGTRMRAALTATTAGRNNLISAANLAATGALAPMPDLRPVADFTENKATGAGVVTDSRSRFLTFNNAASFVFRNASWNDTVSSVAWTFSNGATTPASTSMTTVTNKFSMPGWVTVKLKATSNAGSDSVTNTQAVYVADTTSVGGIGYVQNFSSASAISNWPMFNYYNNQFKWELFSGAGLDDASCLRFHSWDGSSRTTGEATGDIDDIYTPSLNLSASTTGNLYLNFQVNGASTTSGLSAWDDMVNDSLEIDASNSGGVRWQKIGGVSGLELATAGTKSTEYATPLSTKWVQKGVSIPVAYRTANSFFRIRYRAGNTGNNVYVDKFYISGSAAGVAETIKSSNTFAIYPNPASAGCTLAFNTGNSGEVSYTITDLAGKVVYTAQKTVAPNSVNEETISRSATPAAGMYFVTVTIEGVSATQKLVVY